MIISEKQIMLLISVAQDFIRVLDNVASQGIAEECPEIIRDSVSGLLRIIRDQQSEELKEVK